MRRVVLVALMFFLLIPGAFISPAVSLVSPKVAAEASAEMQTVARVADICESIESVSTLTGLKRANIVAPFDIGPKILLNTPHSVLASSHHRNEKGMRAHIDIYRLPPAESHDIVRKHKVTHIVACSDEAEMKGYEKRNPDGLWAQLAQGNTPHWLEQMPDKGNGLKVWRVR